MSTAPRSTAPRSAAPRPRSAAQRSNAASAARSAPPRARRTPFVVLVLSLAVGGMGLLLALNTASAANELRRHDLAARDQTLSAQLEQLQNDVAASAAPGALQAAAAALGMVPAGNPAFLSVGPDGKVRVLGSAGPATAAPLPAPPTTPATTPAATTSKAKAKAAKDKAKAAKKKARATHTPSAPTTSTTQLPGGPR